MGANQEAMAQMNQGIQMVDNLFTKATQLGDNGEDDRSDIYEEQAKMKELDALGTASTQRRQTRKRASQIHDASEQARAKTNAQWGQSGLAVGGSHELVKAARQTQDSQLEKDELFEGEMAQRNTLNQGKRSANLYRINQGLTPNKSTLSLGSTIYKYGS